MCLPIPQDKVDQNKIIASLCQTVNELNKKIKNIKYKIINMTLLYKISRDDDASSTFHSNCDNRGPTLTLIKNTKGYRF